MSLWYELNKGKKTVHEEVMKMKERLQKQQTAQEKKKLQLNRKNAKDNLIEKNNK